MYIYTLEQFMKIQQKLLFFILYKQMKKKIIVERLLGCSNYYRRL